MTPDEQLFQLPYILYQALKEHLLYLLAVGFALDFLSIALRQYTERAPFPVKIAVTFALYFGLFLLILALITFIGSKLAPMTP